MRRTSTLGGSIDGKKGAAWLGATLIVLAAFLPFTFLSPGKAALLSTVVLSTGFILRYRNKTPESKEIALAASLVAIAAASRVAFAAVPSVQPATLLITVTGAVLGPGFGLTVGASTALVSNFFLGHGPWTPVQMIAWGLVGGTAGLIGKPLRRSKTLLTVFVVAWGFLFGLIMDGWYWLVFVEPHTPAGLFAVLSMGMWFNILHAAGNLIFAQLLGERLIETLERFKRRLTVAPAQRPLAPHPSSTAGLAGGEADA